MRGTVNARIEATMALQVWRHSGRRQTIAAVIDTGYSGMLSPPKARTRALRLRPKGERAFILADGSRVVSRYYEGAIVWNGRRCAIDIDEAESVPLLGMELLSGFGLYVQVVPGGQVILKRLHRQIRSHA